MEELVKLYEDIEVAWSDFLKEKEKVLKGQGTAGTRARGATNELVKLFKEYRKTTIELHKEAKAEKTTNETNA